MQGLLEIFSYFLLVLIGVELLETLKAYLKKDVIHVRLVLEVALIAVARKVIILEPNSVPGSTMFGVAALICAFAVAFYFERQAHRDQPSRSIRESQLGNWFTTRRPRCVERVPLPARRTCACLTNSIY